VIALSNRLAARRALGGVVCLATMLATVLAARAQVGPASAAGLRADQAAAARRVMMQALQGPHHGGCQPLPNGWAILAATIRFPDSYGGYGSWVNNAELLPVGDDLSAFLKSHSPGAFIQPAFGDDTQVHTQLCAPAGFSYWLVVDSGMAKVAIGRVTLLHPARTYAVTMTAPPLHH